MPAEYDIETLWSMLEKAAIQRDFEHVSYFLSQILIHSYKLSDPIKVIEM